MKHILSTLLALATFTTTHAQQQYHIEGNAPGFDQQKVFLTDANKQVLDSAVVLGGRFLLENELQAIAPVYIKVGNGREMFLLTEKPTTINVKADTVDTGAKKIAFPRISVSGDADQPLFRRKNQASSAEMLSMMAIAFLGESADSLRKDSLIQLYVQTTEAHKQLNDSITQHCKDSYVSALIMLNDLSKSLPGDKLSALFETLTPRVKESSLGQQLAAKIQQMMSVGVGAVAPNFTCTTPDGKTFSLDELKGSYKCLLIDFWASWCGPCLREAPNIRSVYADYKDKGFQVLSVSIDNDRDKWLSAIDAHQLTWLHTSDLKGWKSDVAKLYNVSAVPAMFLLNKDGVIVSTNARGEALHEFVERETR